MPPDDVKKIKYVSQLPFIQDTRPLEERGVVTLMVIVMKKKVMATPMQVRIPRACVCVCACVPVCVCVWRLTLRHLVGDHGIRSVAADAIDANAEVEFNGASLRQWIEWETDMTPDQYAARMRVGKWGG